MAAPKRPIRTQKASIETVPESAEAVRDARESVEEVSSSPPGRAGDHPIGGLRAARGGQTASE